MRDLVQCRLCRELRKTEQIFSEKDACAAQCRYFESIIVNKLYL